jgi:hypothetical protein
VRIQCPENLRIPPLGSSLEGESGPKARPKGVVDGKQVNIPVLFYVWYRGTEKVDVSRYWISMEVLEVLRGRRKTILELRNDPYKFFELVLTPYHASKKSSNYFIT